MVGQTIGILMTTYKIPMEMDNGMQVSHTRDADQDGGPFNPMEYYDFNNNGQYDSNLSQVFKQGAH